MLLAAFWTPSVAAARTLEVIVPDAWLPGTPVLVRVEVHDADGAVDRTLWDAEAVLSVAPAATTLTPNRVTLRNGMGSALVRIEAPAGTTEVTLTTAIDALQTTRTLRNLTGQAQTEAKGTLSAAVIEWSGIVHVTGALTVPAGGTLRVLPGTLVLVDGSTADAAGYSIDVKGTIECLGTAAQPVTFTARNAAVPWGELHHDGAALSHYEYTVLTRGGNSSRGGHTNTGPILKATNSKIICKWCSFTDTKGKTMQASGADVEFYDCLFSRSVMGPEIGGTALIWERCWAQEFYGTDDNDGIYLHDQSAGQVIALRGCVVASGDDDAVDTLGSDVTIEDCILRDFQGLDQDAKGLSVLNGEVDVARTLIVNCKVAVSAKIQVGQSSTVRIDRSTILGNDVGIQAYDKYGIDVAPIYYYVSNSIIRAPDAVYTDYLPEDIHISYSNVFEAWPGTGNITADPLFVDPAAHDFNLQEGSPCIDTGDPVATPDPDGSRADMGCFPFAHDVPPAPPRFIRGCVNADSTVDLSDAVALLLHLFAGRAIPCAKAADANDSGTLDIADAVRLLDYLFAHGEALPAPAGTCGVDTTDDLLGCAASPCP